LAKQKEDKKDKNEKYVGETKAGCHSSCLFFCLFFVIFRKKGCKILKHYIR